MSRDPITQGRLLPGRPWPVSPYEYPLNPSTRGPVYLPPQAEEVCSMWVDIKIIFKWAAIGAMCIGAAILAVYLNR